MCRKGLKHYADGTTRSKSGSLTNRFTSALRILYRAARSLSLVPLCLPCSESSSSPERLKSGTSCFALSVFICVLYGNVSKRGGGWRSPARKCSFQSVFLKRFLYQNPGILQSLKAINCEFNVTNSPVPNTRNIANMLRRTL